MSWQRMLVRAPWMIILLTAAPVLLPGLMVCELTQGPSQTFRQAWRNARQCHLWLLTGEDRYLERRD